MAIYQKFQGGGSKLEQDLIFAKIINFRISQGRSYDKSTTQRDKIMRCNTFAPFQATTNALLLLNRKLSQEKGFAILIRAI